MWKRLSIIWILSLFLLALLPSVNSELLRHYLCDESSGTVLTDDTGSSDGTVSSTSIWDPSGGQINGACYFDDTYFATIDLGSGYTTWSVAMWIKMDFYDGALDDTVMGNLDDSHNYLKIEDINTVRARHSDGSSNLFAVPDMTTGTWYHIVWTSTSTAGNVYYNTSASSSNPLGDTDLFSKDFYIGDDSGEDSEFDGRMDDIRIYNEVIDSDVIDCLYNSGLGTQSICLGFAPYPRFLLPGINNTAPNEDDYIKAYITINTTEGVSGYIFSWDNGTGTFQNDSWVDLSGATSTNVSVEKVIEREEGTTIQYQWYANSSINIFDNSDTYSVVVAGTTPPNVTINPSNFFSADNKTILSINHSFTAFANLTFKDNIDLYAFEIKITDAAGNLIFNLTNTSISGTEDSFEGFLTVNGTQGLHTVNITTYDSHTERNIKDIKVDDGIKNYIEFDDKIRITAEGAVFSSSDKFTDRYDFSFRYMPFIAPKQKKFILESDSPLELREGKYKAHFVDWKNRRWIDFEGVPGKPRITRISDYKFEIVFDHTGSSIRFRSIGGLNQNQQYFKYYLSNPGVSFYQPGNIRNTIVGNSFFVSVNVTGNGRNTTIIDLYDSSFSLSDSETITNNGTGTYFYNATFTSLTGDNYTINATHYDVNMESNMTEKTLEIYKLQITECGIGIPTINFTLRDETNESKLFGDFDIDFDYNGTTKTTTFSTTATGVNNVSLCLYPAFDFMVADYTINYEAANYPERSVSVEDINLNNETQVKDLYLLNLDSGIYGTFRVIDTFQTALSGVKVVVTEQATSNIVETRFTDAAGVVSIFVDPDTTYIFTFSLDGYSTSTHVLRVTTTEIFTVTLSSGSTEAFTSYSSGITYSFSPENEILNNKTPYNFQFNLTSTFWNISTCTFRLKNESETLAQASCHYNRSQLNVTLAYNTGNQDLIIAQAEYQIDGTSNNTFSNSYRVSYNYEGRSTLKTFLDDITNFSGAAFGDFERFLIGIFITLLVVGGLSVQSGDFREPEILIPAAWAMVGFFSYIGWFNLPLDTIPSAIGQQWVVFALVSLLGGGYIVRKHIL